MKYEILPGGDPPVVVIGVELEEGDKISVVGIFAAKVRDFDGMTILLQDPSRLNFHAILKNKYGAKDLDTYIQRAFEKVPHIKYN